jgi:hypothetical protein
VEEADQELEDLLHYLNLPGAQRATDRSPRPKSPAVTRVPARSQGSAMTCLTLTECALMPR